MSTEINSFNDETSRILVDVARDRIRNPQFRNRYGTPQQAVDVGKLFLTPIDGIPARIGLDVPKATCKRVLLKNDDTLEILSDREAELWNTEGVSIPGNKVVRAYLVTDKWVVDPSSSVRLKFRAITAIAYRKFLAQGVDGLWGQFEITDPHNLWHQITPGCIGSAFVNKFGEWEVETCSLVANEIRVQLQTTLKASDTEGTATVASDYYLRSSYPNVMEPQFSTCSGSCTYEYISAGSWTLTESCPSGCECAPAPTDVPQSEDDYTRTFPCASSGAKEVTFSNPWHLDGMCDSPAILRRVTNADWGKPVQNNFTETPSPAGSATAFRWEIVQVKEHKARRIKFVYRFGNSDIVPTDVYDGFDPTECEDDELIIEYPHDKPCDGDEVTAWYDRFTDKYQGYVTRSAMLGPPEPFSVVTNQSAAPCGVELERTIINAFKIGQGTSDCDNPVSTSVIVLGSPVKPIISMSSMSCGVINYSDRYIRAFICDDEEDEYPDGPQVHSFYINFDGVLFVYAADFGPPTCTQARYRIGLNIGLSEWELVTPCAAGCSSTPPPLPDPIPTIATEQLVDCDANPNALCGLNLYLRGICQDTYSTPPTIVHVSQNLQMFRVQTDTVDMGPGQPLRKYFQEIAICATGTITTEDIESEPCIGSGGTSGGGA